MLRKEKGSHSEGNVAVKRTKLAAMIERRDKNFIDIAESCGGEEPTDQVNNLKNVNISKSIIFYVSIRFFFGDRLIYR